ncbi:hypothetical protein AMECASPLE_003654 [Ameca splendens]|uniref:Uncharacterized protein n=1 Tax=Ameca splendens TaxID=208324 RepID=A0ABV0YKP6_9TELE
MSVFLSCHSCFLPQDHPSTLPDVLSSLLPLFLVVCRIHSVPLVVSHLVSFVPSMCPSIIVLPPFFASFLSSFLSCVLPQFLLDPSFLCFLPFSLPCLLPFFTSLAFLL